MKNKIFGLFICMLLFTSLSTSQVIADNPPLATLNPPSGSTIGILGEEYIVCFTLPNDTKCEPYYAY